MLLRSSVAVWTVTVRIRCGARRAACRILPPGRNNVKDRRPAGRTNLPGQRFEAGTQTVIGDRAQARCHFTGHVGGGHRRRRRAAARPHLAMFQRDPRNRAITEKPVHPVDDFGRDLLKHRRQCAFHCQRQRALTAFSLWKANRIGDRGICVTLAHDFTPAADDRTLHETEAMKGRAPHLRNDIGNRPRPSRTVSRSRMSSTSSGTSSGLSRSAHTLPMP